MLLDFHVSPEGHVYAFALGKPDEPVIVYRSAVYTDGRRLDSNCNVRQNRPLFIENEAVHWPGLGYYFFGRLKLVRAKTREHAKARLDALLPSLDALWKAVPIPATAQRDFPRNRKVLTDAAEFLQQKVLDSVLVDPAPPSRYQWDALS